jgi:hypothetical protein
MKTTITILLAFIFSVNVMADCRPTMEQDITRRIISDGKLVKAGKIATGAAFVTVGGFWGTMGVIMLGPLWAGAVVGATFGAAVAVPVGATFVIIHKAKINRIKNLGRTLSIISSGEELNLLHERMLAQHPELTLSQLQSEIHNLNSNMSLCDGTVARFDRELRSKKRLMATPKDIERYLDAKLELMKSSTSEALPLNLM